MNPVAEDILMHYGVKRRSGRYPYGSGKEPYQHSGDFLSRIEELKKQGLSEVEIAKSLEMSTTVLRTQVRMANHERRNLEVARAKSLKADGLGYSEIGRIMGKNESTIRSLLDEKREANNNKAMTTANALKEELKTKRMIDIGAGVETMLGVSTQTMKEAQEILRIEGYNLYPMGIPQVTNKGKQSNTVILCRPDVEYREVYQNMGEIQSVGNFHSVDGGNSFKKLQYPASVSSDRVFVRYAEDGGVTKDGVIEIRRGVPDLDLGNSHYAQVRILLDDKMYAKGMALYSDNIPEGYDMVVNSNRKRGTPYLSDDPNAKTVFKPIKNDPDNPFGSAIKANGQSTYIDKNGKEQLSAINKLKEEGEWDTASSKNLSSQFLSKQPMPLIKKQLKLTYEDRLAEYESICELNNPTIKRKLLKDFADDCDAATVHLKAAALPRQQTHVILPIDELKSNEIYAPNYNNGEQVALVRYPHGGTFEIPVLTVNNKNKAAKNSLGNVRDAVGINSKVAERLSGADFDGDTVIVIPTNDKVRIKSTPALEGLKGFDTKDAYPYREGIKTMPKSMVQKEMGMISNLITDMTLRGAKEDELVRAVKHSMVVIDAHKHKLDYKRSEQENGIAELKSVYQKRVDDDGVVKYGGASTLLSRKKQTVRVPERKGQPNINLEGKPWYDPTKPEGAYIYKESGRTYIDKKTGKVTPATKEVSRMSITDDAHKLSSGTLQEIEYANYANKMKALANQARKEYMTTGRLKYDKEAAVKYKTEVKELKDALDLAAMNAPRERQANAIANSVVKAKMQANPDMDKKEIKKLKSIEVDNARAAVGASGKETRIALTDKQWEAIQAGAISDNMLTNVLRYANAEDVRKRATPRAVNEMSTVQVNRAKNMARMGYTTAEIAAQLGKSTSTISNYLNN